MFGLARKVGEPTAQVIADVPAAASGAAASGNADRRELLERISTFLLDNELEVNPANLALAQTRCSGTAAGVGEAAAWPQRLQPALADTTTADLTGLDNRQTFAAGLERDHRAARAAGEPLSIALCDIDNIKAVNDTHGNDTGDRVIQAVARVMQRISGRNCHVARHDGGEFVLLFRGLTPDQARNELDIARENFSQRRLVDRETRLAIGKVSFSGGVADMFAYDDPHAALKAAGEALSTAKAQGRSRIVVARTGA